MHRKTQILEAHGQRAGNTPDRMLIDECVALLERIAS